MNRHRSIAPVKMTNSLIGRMAIACVSLLALDLVPIGTPTYAADAVFTPTGSTIVPAGTPVEFELTVAAVSLSEFDAADIVVGCDAAPIALTYSPNWIAAFAHATQPAEGPAEYTHDVFAGGNNTTPVNSTVIVGFVTLDTSGLAEGAYEIRIDAALDSGISTLSLAGTSEPLTGSAQFIVGCTGADMCNDRNPCTFDRCIGDDCDHLPALFGDVAGAGPECGPDGTVNIFDIFAVLDAFQDQFADGCSLNNLDLAGNGNACIGDGSINIFDILAVLDAFQDNTDCCP